MAKRMSRLKAPKPETLLDLTAQLHRDEAEPLDRLRRRDREIGQHLGIERSDATQSDSDKAGRLTAWLEEIEDAPRIGERLRVVGLIAVVIGLLLGYATAMALFYYDGSTPVNVVRVLAVFVGLQAVTLLLFVLAVLPGNIPGLGGLRDLSPARLATFVTRWLPGETRAAVEQVLGRGRAHQRVYRGVQNWQLLAWSQAMALAFNLAAVGGALQLIVFTDLGFGWSTTLQAEAEDMHGLTSAVAWPWSGMWEAAVPEAGLVAETQTYRAENFRLGVKAEDSAKWWPFLVMAIMTYGVLPRLVTLTLSRLRLSRAVVRAVATTPGADRVLDRLTAAVVETRGTEHEASGGGNGDAAGIASQPSAAGCVIGWAGVDGEDDTLAAGGDRSLEEDRQAIALAVEQSGGRAVLVRVKAWEPPVLEFLDFLGDLRSALGDGTPIEVLPVGEGDWAVWQKKLASVGDPWMRLVKGDGEGVAS
ncbi:MAG: DUF2868 domain-containing protein [Planctomycetota bacterium]